MKPKSLMHKPKHKDVEQSCIYANRPNLKI